MSMYTYLIEAQSQLAQQQQECEYLRTQRSLWAMLAQVHKNRIAELAAEVDAWIAKLDDAAQEIQELRRLLDLTRTAKADFVEIVAEQAKLLKEYKRRQMMHAPIYTAEDIADLCDSGEMQPIWSMQHVRSYREPQEERQRYELWSLVKSLGADRPALHLHLRPVYPMEFEGFIEHCGPELDDGNGPYVPLYLCDALPLRAPDVY